MLLDPNRVEEVFTPALQQGSDNERAAFVETACAGDVALRDRVEALLRAHEEASHFLNRAAVEQFVAQPSPTEALASGPVAPELTATHAEQPGDGEENALDFLQPSTKPGALGRLGHYEVLEVLGQGGFGIVLKAFDELLHRVVAIKVMSTQLAATSPARKRFLREARAAAKVRHENVVAIYDVQEQPIPYLVMEYIAGETLQQRLDRAGPLDTPEVLRLGQHIAGGLAAAHAMGLIHRDIKPSNILLENGVELRVKITDFGLARAADDASLTQSGFIAGTPMYMAPEQAEGEVIDQRADLFSLGSVLYVMCSGRPPFRASTTMAVLKRVTEDTPRPIREIIPEVPEWLCAIVAKLHAKNRAERFQSAKEVADLLSQHLAHVQQPTLAPPPASIFPANEKQPHARRTGRPVDLNPSKRRKHVLLNILIAFFFCGALACILACILGVLLWPSRNPEPPISSPGVITSMPPLAKAPFSAAEARQYQEAWAKYLGAPVENTNSAGTTMVLVPPGEFLMGMTGEQVAAALKDKDPSHWLYNNYRESSPQHKVTISKPFYMAATEVTIAQFRVFIADTGYRTEAERDGKGGTRWDDKQKKLVQEKDLLWDAPGYGVSRDMPVTQVTWNDAVAYCNWLSKREALSRRYEETRESWDLVSGDGYSLPTEAEWEYACKAGTTTLYSCGNDEETLGKYAWYSRNSDGRPHSVGTKLANAFGLFDMHGNASEFCQDFYSGSYYAPRAATDPRGPDVSRSHVRRGGHWDADADAAPSALRMSLFVHDRQRSTGFRVVRELPNVSVGKIEIKELPPSPVAAPFVILAKDAKAERQFATLADAVAAAQAGDTVEIRGDGPFVTATVAVNCPLTIRAREGFRPVLKRDLPDGVEPGLLKADSALVLEGLELQDLDAKPQPGRRRILVQSSNAPLMATNCRFVTSFGTNRAYHSPRVEFRNCELISGWNMASAIDWSDPPTGGSLRMQNCVTPNWALFLNPSLKELKNVEIEFAGNSFSNYLLLSCYSGGELRNEGKTPPPFRVKAINNVLHTRNIFRVEMNQAKTNIGDWPLDRVNRLAQSLFDWQGDRNVCSPASGYELWYGNDQGKAERSTKSRAQWTQIWGANDANALEGEIRFKGDGLTQRAFNLLTAEDFRLADGSAGKGKGEAGKDLGADIDLVGPGAAYERWKQTPEYQEWQKKTAKALAGK